MKLQDIFEKTRNSRDVYFMRLQKHIHIYEERCVSLILIYLHIKCPHIYMQYLMYLSLT